MDVTTGEAAARLGITGAGLNKWAEKLGIAKRREGRRVLISLADLDRIRDAREAGSAVVGEAEHRTKPGSMLADHLNFLQSQLRERDRQIERLQFSLAEAQRQAAESQRQLAAPRREIVAVSPELVEEWQKERRAIEDELERILGG